MTIKVSNYRNGDVLNISLPLLIGEVIVSGDSKIIVNNLSCDSDAVEWPVINGKFKILVQLQNGQNKIELKHKTLTLNINLIYEPLESKHFVRLVYIKCQDDDGFFQAPLEEINDINSACNRITLGARMLQTFTYDAFKEHNLPKKAFRLEEVNGKVICHVFTSSLHLFDAIKLNEEELWAHFAVELMNSSLRVSNDCKFLAFLSFTRYCNTSDVPPQKHQDVLKMTKGNVALGGGGLALFGSGCLHTWPQNLQEVPWRFGDKRKIDRMEFMDDSANRGFYWACYSTNLGATLHELGHTFDLGHTKGGIMARGFDDIYKYFIVDMFYYDNMFQREHNPYYFEASIYNHTVKLSTPSPSSDETDKSLTSFSLQEYSSIEDISEAKCISEDKSQVGERPSRVPNPPDEYSSESKFGILGGAYWTRSSALILYYHKWFNNYENCEKDAISFKNMKLSSPHGIQIVEFRDLHGTLFHHLEFPEDSGALTIDLTSFDITDYIPDGIKSFHFLAEDHIGNIFKSCGLNASELS